MISKDFAVKYLRIKVPRNQIDNLQTKAQAYSTINGTKTLHPADALDIVEITTDIDSKIERGRKYWEEQAEKENELKKSESDIKLGQEQKNQYNTNLIETKEKKKIIKEESKAEKQERVY